MKKDRLRPRVFTTAPINVRQTRLDSSRALNIIHFTDSTILPFCISGGHYVILGAVISDPFVFCEWRNQ